VHVVLRDLGRAEQARLRGQCAIPPDAIDRPVACRRHEPTGRVRGDSVARPALGSDRECLLNGFLGEVEVAEEADQRGEHAAPLIAESLFECGYHSTNGRTSTAPPMEAAGTREATSMA